MEETPVVVDAEIVDAPKPEAPKVSPAKDLREIQALLVNGVFSGNMAPAVVKAHKLLEEMALVVEKEASKDAK